MSAAEQDPNGAANGPDDKPFFSVTRGNPTPTEVGVLAAVLATAQGNAIAAGEDRSGVKDDWGSYADRLRSPFGYNPSSFLNARQY